jgi:TRAP-type C4-dicarboxylate transport system substrate-binding protein
MNALKLMTAFAVLFVMIMLTLVGTASAKTITLKYSVVQLKGTRAANFADMVAEIVNKKTKGSLMIKVYYGGILADETLPPVQAGVTDITGIAMGVGVSKNVIPWSPISHGMYLFDIAKNFHKVMDPKGEFLTSINNVLKEHNVRYIGVYNLGTRHVTSNKPIYSPADLTGMKLRTPPVDFMLKFWEIMGARPTPVPIADLSTALLTGQVDAQENPVTHIKDYSLYEVQKYLMYTGHMLSPVTACMNYKSWMSLDTQQQEALTEAALEASEKFDDETSRLEEESRKLGEKNGMKFIGPEQGLRIDLFKEKAKEVYEYYKKDWGEWPDKIKKIIGSK